MRIEVQTASYNDRRYGKPWIAMVDFSGGGLGEFKFGSWCGYPGEPGLLEIEAELNQVVALGQRDHRKQKNSAPEYFHPTPDGKLQPFSTRAEAYKWWRDNNKQEG